MTNSNSRHGKSGKDNLQENDTTEGTLLQTAILSLLARGGVMRETNGVSVEGKVQVVVVQ